MRGLLLTLGVLTACTPGAGSVVAERQTCVECALREHSHPDSLSHAVATFTAACDRGDLRSCSALGVMYERGRGVERDPARAARLFGLACRGGNARACVSLGSMMRDGSAARPDPDGALTMFGVACAQGELQGCFEEGRMLAELGKLRKGASVLSDACERRHAASCELLGEMVATGRGVARSKRRASKLFRRACLSGRTEACTRL